MPSTSLFAWLLALCLAAWVAADLFWRFAAPRPAVFPIAAESDTGRAAQAIASRHFMGEVAVAAPTSDAGRFSLFGVVTGDEQRPGFAVLAVDGGAAQGVVAGGEVVPGVVLARILADHVELVSATGRQSVSLSSRPALGAAVQDAPVGPAPLGGPMPLPGPAVGSQGGGGDGR